MASLPLEVHQVLEEEYVAMYGPLDRPKTGADYDAGQILNAARVYEVLRACGVAGVTRQNIVGTLNGLIAADAAPSLLERSPSLTDRGRRLLTRYDELLPLARERDAEWGARELRRAILDEALYRLVKPFRDVRLDNVYDAVHGRVKRNEEPRSALCISGGGIRSATFALGVIQGLASAGILKKFDYLSTVSGGGYIGSWLSSWVRRHPEGMKGVEEELHRTDTAIAHLAEDDQVRARQIPSLNVDPEPPPVRHLREYSNYMSPRLGIFSGDSWTIASHYLRNLLLNLLVLVPLLALALAIPRFFSWGLRESQFLEPINHLWIVALCTTIAFAYIGAVRPLGRAPSANARRFSSNKCYAICVVLPLVIAASSLALFWVRAAEHVARPLIYLPSTRWAFLAIALSMVIVPWAVYYGRLWLAGDARRNATVSTAEHRRHLIVKTLAELGAVIVALLSSAALFYLLAEKVFPTPFIPTPDTATRNPLERLGMPSSPQAQLYVCFAVPAALLIFFIQASIFVGLSSRRNEDADREWWGRGGALLLMAIVGLAVFSVISVFGPVALYNAPTLLGSIGGVAGVAAALLGFSDKTPANQKQKEKGGATAKLGNAASAFIAPLFVVFILALISLGSTWLIQELTRTGYDAKAWARLTAMTFEYSETATTDGAAEQEVTRKLPAQPFVSAADLRTYAHLETIRGTTSPQLLAFLGAGLFAFVLSFAIGVNKFSMHALYRNRLIRAYLGASRDRRNADRFTGFDEADNLQMWELRPELLWKTQIRDGFVDALRTPAADGSDRTKLASYLWSSLDAKTRKLMDDPSDDGAMDTFAANVNHLLMTADLATEAGVKSIVTGDTTKIGHGLAYRNRVLLDTHFGAWIATMPRTPDDRGPLHVVNTALNLTTGSSLAWQQRMAESFTVTPYHAGSLYVGYRGAREYGGSHGISLGSAVTISGAAASPNMGYHSSPAMAFLLTMFNVRLGSWLGNPGLSGEKSHKKAHPSSNLRALVHELTGGSTDRSKWVYLSDGGHFENLGLYEMVLRRCHYIVLSDAGADPKFSFEDLGNAIRKIRTDLGVPIDIDELRMKPRKQDDGSFDEGRFVARGRIRYSVVDENGEDGTLIYIKAGIYAEDDYLPRDVYNYAQESLLFPHEPTSDQFFSESQFESYRALGRHAVNAICENYKPEKKPTGELDTTRIPIARRFASLTAFAGAVFGRHTPPPDPPPPDK